MEDKEIKVYVNELNEYFVECKLKYYEDKLYEDNYLNKHKFDSIDQVNEFLFKLKKDFSELKSRKELTLIEVIDEEKEIKSFINKKGEYIIKGRFYHYNWIFYQYHEFSFEEDIKMNSLILDNKINYDKIVMLLKESLIKFRNPQEITIIEQFTLK